MARWLEGDEKMESKDAPTSSWEKLKMVLGSLERNGCKCESMDVRTAYLHREEIKRTLWLKPGLGCQWQ